MEYHVARATAADVGGLEAATVVGGEDVFGGPGLAGVVENAGLAVVARTGDGTVVAVAAFASGPTHLADMVDASSWTGWVAANYNLEAPLTPATASWLTYYAAAADHASPRLLTTLLTAAFATMTSVNTLVVGLLPHVELGAAVPELLAALDVAVEAATPAGEAIFLAGIARHAYVPKLKIRPAAVEDNDDLAPILDAQSELVSATYGEFFLSDLIEGQDANNRVIVAEVDGYAVGLMALVADVDVTLLQECFELEPFNELLSFPGDTAPWLADADADADADAAAGGDDADADAFLNVGISLADETADDAASPAADLAPVVAPLTPSASSASLSSASSASSASSGRSSTSGSSYSRSDSDAAGDDAPASSLPPTLNAFAVSLFTLADAYTSRSVDFLPFAFSLFPDRDYCILTLPHATPAFPLLAHFTQIPPKSVSTFPHALYVAHRGALEADITVRRAVPDDAAALARLLDGVQDADAILDSYNDVMRLEAQEQLRAVVFSSLSTRIYVATAEAQVIGVFVTSSELDIRDVALTYDVAAVLDLDARPSPSHLALPHVVINPVFAHASSMILDELLRVTGKGVIHFRVWRGAPVPPLIELMIRVRPRRTLAPPHAPRDADEPDDEPLTGPLAHPFAALPPAVAPAYGLFVFASKLRWEPKVVVNARIVVVGASETALSFLETIIFTPYLHVPNVTVIAPGGLPTLAPAVHRAFLPHTLNYTEQLLSQLALGASVSVLDTKAMMIDRDLHAVMLADGSVLPYEKLVLATGKQFTAPPLDADAPGEILDGVFALNSEHDVDAIVAFCDAHVISTGERAVVYGGGVEAHAAVYGLMAAGVDPSQITFLVPPPPHAAAAGISSCFNEFHVDELVADWVARLGVKLVRDLSVVGYEHRSGALLSLTLAENGAGAAPAADPIRLPASMLIVACGAEVDADIFHAINGCCLVYDGGLVVDAAFRTIDPDVYGGGPLTRWANRYYAGAVNMAEWNSLEVGAAMALSVLAHYDTVAAPLPPPADLPVFDQPLAVGMALVSPPSAPVYYFHFGPPGPVIPYARAKEAGWDEVGGVSATGVYFALTIDEFGIVIGATYVGTAPVAAAHLLALYGLPASYLMLDAAPPNDLLAWVSSPLLTAIFHDNFGALRAAAIDALPPDFTDRVHDAVDGWGGVVGPAERAVVDQWLRDKDDNDAAVCGEDEVVKRVLEWVVGVRSEGVDMYHVPAAGI